MAYSWPGRYLFQTSVAAAPDNHGALRWLHPSRHPFLDAALDQAKDSVSIKKKPLVLYDDYLFLLRGILEAAVEWSELSQRSFGDASLTRAAADVTDPLMVRPKYTKYRSATAAVNCMWCSASHIQALMSLCIP